MGTSSGAYELNHECAIISLCIGDNHGTALDYVIEYKMCLKKSPQNKTTFCITLIGNTFV